MIKNEFYDNIKKMAWEANVSVNALCKAAKVSPTSLWRWKNGQGAPNLSTLQRLTSAYDALKKKNKFLKK